ncbi:hypothetical protein [Caldimonas brevitalea]|uniref:MalT-like TPR region domain-containing protein n=1 Tax=Caldimonas brevitalea TaxID=413882 RepID=A0A0G3BSP6_9BURK|nr:hypothetical protein [Caldimonas brevitalea]AKJ29570.1 hypothetical protein AAW51_2879 [Caldimonas brevitalea]
MALNPVERKLVELLQLWESFRAEPGKRLLLWQAPDNGKRLIECFCEVQRHASPYASGDTFIVFDAAFEQSIGYSRALKQALAGHYAASHEDLEREGLKADWRFEPEEQPDTASAFVQGLAALATHHPALGHLVAVLLPSAVANDEAWAAWVARVLEAAGPAKAVRLLVPDFSQAPRLTALAEAQHPLVQVQQPPLDAWSIAQETFAQEPAVGAPGVFRSLLTALFALAEKGTADQVLLKARDALAFAHKQGWADQEVAVRLVTAGAMLKDQRFDAALNHYQHARTSAEAARAAQHPAGGQLVLQTWFGEAAAHLAAGQPEHAAPCYREAAQLAAALPNPPMLIEALRMASFCHARAGEPEDALALGRQALAVGERLKPEARPMTTLPLLGFELLKLVEPERAAEIEAVKHGLDREQAQHYVNTEERAAALETAGDPVALKQLERQHAEQEGLLVQQARQRADEVAADGTPAFMALFVQARTLLGADWPLVLPGAIAKAPPVPAGGTAA